MCEYRFTHGDIEQSLSIMREAAMWLEEKGQPMWRVNQLNTDVLSNPAGEFIVMYGPEGESIATLLLSFEDKFFWPNIPAGESGFIHKLSVKRKYAGKGMAYKLIDYAVSICREKGIPAARLDCDPNRKSLTGFYERYGFDKVEKMDLDTTLMGRIGIALYQLDITEHQE